MKNTATAAVIIRTQFLRAAMALRASLRRWAIARKQTAEDNEFWKLALTDHRLMADISRNVGSRTARATKRLP